MPVIGHGVEICTYATRPSNPALGTIIYQTDTDEYLKWVNYGGANRWMQADVKANRRMNINGDLRIWQRGTGPIGEGFLADRYIGLNLTSHSRSADTPSNTGFPYSISFGHSSAAYPLIYHRLEANDSFRALGKHITLSFWAKNVSGSAAIYVDFLNANASDNWTSNTIWNTPPQTNIPTSTWTYYSFTSSIVAPAGVANGLGFYIPRNNVSAATTLVTGMQLEVGTAPSEFEFRDYADELTLAQRYYCRSFDSNDYFFNTYVYGAGANSLYKFACPVAFPVEMRRVPDLSVAFTNVDNAVNEGQTVYRQGFTQYYRNGNGSFPYCSWRATYTANAEF